MAAAPGFVQSIAFSEPSVPQPSTGELLPSPKQHGDCTRSPWELALRSYGVFACLPTSTSFLLLPLCR